MAGPSAGVEIPRRLTEAESAEVWAMIDSISSDRHGEDFWVNRTAPIGGRYAGEGRPFFLILSGAEDEHGEGAERYERLIESAFGFRPAQNLGFAAMCNGAGDHRILGELCLWAARRFGGVVGFEGALLPPLPAELCEKWLWGRLPWEEARPLYERLVAGMPGRLAEYLYTPGSQRRTWATHTADAVFMEAWLAHPNFHMIK